MCFGFKIIFSKLKKILIEAAVKNGGLLIKFLDYGVTQYHILI